MGIPFYFGEIISKSQVNKRFNIVVDKLPVKCSRFFLDFNSIIHPCSAQVVSKLNQKVTVDDTLYSKIFDSIASYTLKLIDITQPTDCLYIAIDGIAPRAKMHQQRKRRFLSAQRNKAISAFKEKHKIPDTQWDSNCITPGTDFMLKLDKYLMSEFKDMIQTKYPTLKNFIVSGSNEIGEGEHKMIHYIKTNELNFNNGGDVIYGLDADLIMLSLTTEDRYIVLMRESQDFGQNQSPNKLPFKYLDINNLREGIYDTIGYQSQQTVINDYVFMCYLLGNDFIPALSFLKIKEGAVDVLIECYKEVITNEQNKKHSIIYKENNKYNVDVDLLTNLMLALKNKEDDMFAYVIENYNNALPRPQKNFNTIMQNIKNFNPQLTAKEIQERAVREFSLDLEEYPLRNKYIIDINPKTDKKWRNTYYHYIFGSNSIDNIKNICKKYLEGLLWITNYYFDLSASQEWYYHYHYAPCVSDLHKYLMSFDEETINVMKKELKRNEDIEEKDLNLAHLQLLLVLPPQSKSLLPSHLQPMMTDYQYGCLHYYPTEFKVMTFLKNKMWECTPLIPNINIEQVKTNLKLMKVENNN